MKKKKMMDVWLFDQSEGGDYIRLYNIEGTDDYYVSGKAFDAKDRRHIGGLYFDNPNRWTVDRDGDYHPITELPDYVRDIYLMYDGEITGKLYENPNYMDIVTR